MGCDIHFYVERKVNGAWESADEWKLDTDDEPPRERVASEYYGDRNYNLFAILADVRNGRGFAGLVTGEGFKPISTPKGLPEDASAKVKAESDAWNGDGHSHSWHTLSDLLAYDWTQWTGLSGFVHADQYWAWSRYRKGQGLGPEEYCGDAWGNEVRKVSNDEMGALVSSVAAKHTNYINIKAALEKELNSVYTRVDWRVPYYRCAGSFWGETIPRLLRLGAPDDVRIVFWFDN